MSSSRLDRSPTVNQLSAWTILKSVSRRLLLSAACGILVLGCGYRPLGEGSLPQGIQRVHLAAITNSTFRPGIQGGVEAAVLRRLQFDGRVAVTGEADAEAVLSGQVVAYQNIPIAFDQSDIGRRFRVRIVLEMTLMDRRGAGVLLKEETVGEAYYTAGTGVVGTRSAEDEAIQRAVQDLATRAVARLMEEL